MREIKIAPSILAGDLGHLAEAVRLADHGGADQIHLDVIDGHFAPNITFGAGTVKALRKVSDLPFDTHLMLSDPFRYAPSFIEAGSRCGTTPGWLGCSASGAAAVPGSAAGELCSTRSE